MQGYDMAMRRYHRVWHRYATGLAANMGEPTWLKKEVRTINLLTNAHWGRIVGLAITAYLPPTGIAKIREVKVDDLDPTEKAEVDGCPSNLKGHGVKFELSAPGGVKLGLKLGCEKTTLELSKKIVGTPEGFPIEASASGFIQLEMARKGDVTVFIGPSGKLGVQAPGGSGFGVSAKEGVYIRADAAGVKDVGTRITVESYEKLGPGGRIIASQKAFEKTFSFMPAPPAPTGGPRLATFGGQ
jgi:hypothetical protein